MKNTNSNRFIQDFFSATLNPQCVTICISLVEYEIHLLFYYEITRLSIALELNHSRR